MATIDLAGGLRSRTPRHDPPGMLRAAWSSYLRRREDRRALAAVSRLGPRLIRDIGFDPQLVQERVGGGWGVRFNRSLLPKRTDV